MAESEGEFVADSDDEVEVSGATLLNGTRITGPAQRSATTSPRGGDNQGTARRRAAWEDIQRSWDTVVEGADGSINSTVDGLREAGKRQRLLRDTTPLQRGIIRHVILVLDLSEAMSEKDLRPNRYKLTLRYTSLFITEFFEQNPISQLGIVGMRDGIGIRISELSGNPIDHLGAITTLQTQDPSASPSLQNALEMARANLYHAPSHGTREVLMIYGALLSSDPDDIHTTISSLVKDRIRVSIIGLAAQVAICQELCSRTLGSYSVAIDERHFFEKFMEITTPPVTKSTAQSKSSLLMMGFPSRTVGKSRTMCACHAKLERDGYICSRCGTKVCSLPAECPSCNLTLILSTHLARSYHHLFPLRNWIEVPWSKAATSIQSSCLSCGVSFPPYIRDTTSRSAIKIVKATAVSTKEDAIKGISESGRYECQACAYHFCVDCDVFAHETIHNCPGCQSNLRPPPLAPHSSHAEDMDLAD